MEIMLSHLGVGVAYDALDDVQWLMHALGRMPVATGTKNSGRTTGTVWENQRNLPDLR